MNDLDDTTFARFVERFAAIEQQVPEPPPAKVRPGIESRGRKPLSPVVGVVAVVILLATGVGLAVIGSQLSPRPSPSPAVTIPPDSAPPAVVLDAYLRALQAGDCSTASQLTNPLLLSKSFFDLCAVTRVTAFSVSGDRPLTFTPVEVGVSATLSITGTANGISAGQVNGFYILQQESSGAWRIVDGYIGTSPSMLPTPPT